MPIATGHPGTYAFVPRFGTADVPGWFVPSCCNRYTRVLPGGATAPSTASVGSRKDQFAGSSYSSSTLTATSGIPSPFTSPRLTPARTWRPYAAFAFGLNVIRWLTGSTD